MDGPPIYPTRSERETFAIALDLGLLGHVESTACKLKGKKALIADLRALRVSLEAAAPEARFHLEIDA